jgi:hypothetical protein
MEDGHLMGLFSVEKKAVCCKDVILSILPVLVKRHYVLIRRVIIFNLRVVYKAVDFWQISTTSTQEFITHFSVWLQT